MIWQYLKNVLRYLKGTSELKLTFKRNYSENCETLISYVDSDWAGDKTDRVSTTGYIFKLFKNCSISWCTRKQKSVADSSTAAEYMALYEAAKEAKFLRSLIETANLKLNRCIVIYEDNNGCRTIANNQTSHKLVKYIDFKIPLFERTS